MTYTKAWDRERALVDFRDTPGAVLFAPSFDRGVDLVDDDCRVIIVAKVPAPFLGDAQVKARLNSGREGEIWYTVQTIRTLVQMTGRGVRSVDDHCESYILDARFTEHIYKRHKNLLPEWWRDALDRSFRTRELM